MKRSTIWIWLVVAFVIALFVVDYVNSREPEVRHEPAPVAPAEPRQIRPTTGTANWWCVSGMKCWHTTVACDDDRRKVLAKSGADLPCTAVDVAACLEVERILTKERTRECYASIAYCKAAVQQWRNTEPDDVKVIVECVAE